MDQDPLLPECYYHLFNHAVGNECLFRNRDNYGFFLKRYADYIQPIAKTYAYCLMPNHFHFLVQIRDEQTLRALYHQKKTSRLLTAEVDYSAFVMQQLSNLFNSYAKAYNKRFERRGALFIDKLRRKQVESDDYFTTLIAYIHRNPVHHGFCRRANDWGFSSINSTTSSRSTHLERSAVLDWFGGIESYVSFHQNFTVNASSDDWEFGY